MKVLHVIPSVALIRGGPSHAVLAMIKALRSRDIDAEIASTDDNGRGLLDVPLRQRVEYEGAPVRFFHKFSPPFAFIREFCFSGSMTVWLWKHISEFDLLHIHAVLCYPSTMAMLIARIKRVPYIIRPLGILEKWGLRQGRLKKQIYLNIIERANINHSQAIHFMSNYERDQVSSLKLKPASFILPHGLYAPPPLPDVRNRLRQLLKVPADDPVILYMSRLHLKKGLEYLIPALGGLTNSRFTFILAGNGLPGYEAKVGKLLDSSGISNRTYRPGFVNGETKNLMLQGTDIFVLTSHSENFGLAVLEAMGAGVPVVVTPGVALAAMVKENSLGLVADMDIPSIKSGISYLLNNREEAVKMGQRARQFVLKEHDWGAIASKLARIYSDIIKREAMPLPN